MAANKIYTVGSLGLTEAEQNVLRSIGTLTKGRTEGGYTVRPDAELHTCNLVVVNLDEPDAMQKWIVLSKLPSPPLMVPHVRPFSPGRLLTLLDSMVSTLKDSSEIWQGHSPLQTMAEPSNLVGMRALVVDDSPTVGKQLELELRNFNITADLAETGEQAQDFLTMNRYDAIFLDVVLPGVDGYQLCKEIRKNPKTKQTPVIMLTSKSSPFDKVRGSLVGCDAYLTKPVDYQDFRDAVSKHVLRK